MTASTPVYDKIGKSLIGVCAADLFLPRELSKFLKTLKIGKSGQTFLVERSGVLVSSSTEEPITVGNGKDTKRLKATESLTPEVEQVSQRMEGQFEGARQISEAIARLSKASQQTVESLQQTNSVLEQLNDTA